MRILSCYIAGFGKLVNKKIELKDLTVIKQDNGWGKTTFADFIRCMFFGLDGGRKKEIAENDRAHYRPWSGGTFGGALTFEYNEKIYRVERTFGQTPAQDFARVLDGNQMLCYEFGEKAERLGEILFGMDGDSYRRSVYVPQGEIETGELPDGIKAKLLTLLSASGENGGSRALERLDAADKALRAKRKPAKGKLDEIDERLMEILRLKAEKEGYALSAKAAWEDVERASLAISDAEENIKRLTKEIEQEQKRETLETNRRVYEELKSQYDYANKELARLKLFFGDNNPTSVNTDGLQAAVDEFYALKTQVDASAEELARVQAQNAEREMLLAQITAKEQVVKTYEELLQKGDTQGAGTRRKEKGKKIYPPHRKSTKWILLISLTLAFLGAAFIATKWQLGAALLGVGGLGLLAMFFRTLPKREKVVSNEPTVSQADYEKYEPLYRDAFGELQALQEKLAAYPQESVLDEGQTQKAARMQALEKGIREFLSYFRFDEIYDYRAALESLKRGVEDYKKHSETVQAYAEKAQALSFDDRDLPAYAQDIEVLKAKLVEKTAQKEENLALRSRKLTEAENAEERADASALLGEEERLTEEKTRLEKRHLAIVRAKEILRRAQENLASRYLNGVESGCKQYLTELNVAMATRFAADGRVRVEENGLQRELEYYSVGSKELVDFCTRIALADALFAKEKPTLILDDPFVNFDDEKTERAKAFVKKLSQKYQIVYLTCKTERAF